MKTTDMINPGKCLLFAILFMAAACGNHGKKQPAPVNDMSVEDTGLTPLNDTVYRFTDSAIPDTGNLQARIERVRDNFQRINNISNWSSVISRDLPEPAEGGEGRFFHLNGKLEKVRARLYGETFQVIAEYYLLDGKLSFVYEKIFRYNRPMYYDSAAMKENKDTETFDFSKSKITEVRNYFDNGRLFYQLTRPAPAATESPVNLAMENVRIHNEYNTLLVSLNDIE